MTRKIILNGNDAVVESDRLDQILDELGYAGAVVATALNEDFVPRDKRPETMVQDGDRLEVVAPLQGG